MSNPALWLLLVAIALAGEIGYWASQIIAQTRQIIEHLKQIEQQLTPKTKYGSGTLVGTLETLTDQLGEIKEQLTPKGEETGNTLVETLTDRLAEIKRAVQAVK